MELLKSFIFVWQNAVFSASLAFFLIYIFLQAIVPSHDATGGHDADHDIGGGHDHDHDVSGGHDHDHDADHDHDHDAQPVNPMQGILSYLGVGRCPLSIIVTTFGISWGFFGLCFNGMFADAWYIPKASYFWFSLAGATFLGLLVTRFFAQRIAVWMPKSCSYAVTVEELVGSVGEVTVSIDERSGRTRVMDKYGSPLNVDCKTRPNEPEIPTGRQVILLQYLSDEKYYLVAEKPNLPVA
jgi:hypothetical protein